MDQYRDIFARFQNLNLITLLIDLESNRVAMGYTKNPLNGFLCPLAHGVSNGRSLLDQIAKFPSFDKFVTRWDGDIESENTHNFQKETNTLISDLWKERLEDAHAVQEILNPIMEKVTC